MAIEVRRSRVSCDWEGVDTLEAVTHRWSSHWRVIQDGKLVDSFLSKANAEKKARTLRKLETASS